MGYFSPKNTFLQLKHAHRILWNITFNNFCENLPNDCHFSSHKSFFTFLYFSSSNVMYTFYKSIQPKCKFSDFPLLALKFTKFLMSFFSNKKSVFLQNWIFFSCHEDTSFVLKLYMLLTKVALHQSANFQACYCSH